jgi:hypothetical protein
MRFRVSIDEKWDLTITADGPGGEIYSRRTLVRQVDVAGLCLPMPPGAPGAQLCPHLQPGGDLGELFAIRARIANRDYRGGDLRNFGLYLFDTLIGTQAWEAISCAARARNERLIELALCWPTGEGVLHRLNWEMMHGPDADGFLAAGKQRPVAITRLVAGTRGPDWQAGPIPYPPRVLFVLGSPWTESGIRGIRPATECLGLLRQLRGNGRSIQSLILHRARPGRIKERILSFRPHIVHFVCHGQAAVDEAPATLILEDDDQDERGSEVKGYDSDQILLMLSADRQTQLPTIVVLSACQTAGGEAQMWGVHETAPLAAKLVEGRVPIVVGMSGEVSDRGCRLFTRRFGAALLEGRSLMAAASQARWAALSEGDQAYKSADWSLPTLFMAEAIASEHVPVAPPVPSKDRSACPGVDERLKVYDVERDPVFCGRDEFFAAYHELFHPVGGRRYSVIAAFAGSDEDGLGRTRLLQELTAQAVRDHHIPCLIASDVENWNPPTSREQLVAAMYTAISQAREAFGLSAAFPSQLNVLQIAPPEELRKHAELDAEVRAKLGPRGSELSVAAVRMALRKDLAVLREEVTRSCPDVRDGGGNVVFLLGKVDQYARALDDLLCGLLGPNGLSAAEPLVPVIMAFSVSGPAKAEIDRFVKNVEPNRPWLRPLPLTRFERNEDLLAFERVLLHPFRTDDDTARRAWVINWKAKLDYLRKAHDVYLGGIPMSYRSDKAYVIAYLSTATHTILDADDSDVLKGMPNL